MHELSLCESIARAVTREAGGRRVSSVQLRIGALRQVVPDTLVYCWSITSRGPILDGSVLDVELVPAEIECRDCGATTLLEEMRMMCGSCGSTAVAVTAGEELLVTSIELQEA